MGLIKNIQELQFRKFGIINSMPMSKKKIIFRSLLILVFVIIGLRLVCAQPGNNEFKLDNQDVVIIKRNLAATEKVELSPAELEDFKVSVENKINELQNSIKIIGNKQESDETRNKAVKLALKLFIPKATMQISSKSGAPKSYLMEDYFFRLMSLPYTKVEINFYDLAYISNFYKGEDGNYHATATIFQEFKGYNGDNVAYTDRTSKTIDILLEYVEDQFFKIKRWIVKLGNIKVLETR
jgi:hypothetical protein